MNCIIFPDIKYDDVKVIKKTKQKKESSKESSGESIKEVKIHYTEETEDTDYSKPPVYDGEEPYFMFKRRFDKYIENKHKHKHEKIIEFLNKLFSTKYTNLRTIKKITLDMMPTSDEFVDLMNSDSKNSEMFKIRYNKTIPVHKMINNLLNKINYSFVEKDNGKEIFYSIKAL
jgi:hypothetical protein